MQQKTYPQQYEQLQQLQAPPDAPFKQYLIKDLSTNAYRMARKTSLATTSQKSQDELLNQLTILKELNHPHVIKYYDVFLEEDDFVVVLEFCQEGDLEYYVGRKRERERKADKKDNKDKEKDKDKDKEQDRKEKDKKEKEKDRDKKEGFSQKLILSWVLQILMGLEYIHSKNIIHRLVCSHNIFMNHQGDLKLGSFGGAKMLEDTMDKAMTIVGSACNLSPEIVEGKPYDNKVDIWGLGCLIYQLATYQHPFKITSLPQLYQKIVKTPAEDLPTKYSKYLNPIYKKMMKKNPAFRPSASQLLQQEVFIKLMNQYIKKKKIDSLDLREVVPKQLLVHKRTRNVGRLPPIQGKGEVKMEGKMEKMEKKGSAIRKGSQKSKEKEKDREVLSGSPRLPSLTGKTSDSQQQSTPTQRSPKFLPPPSQSSPKQQPTLPTLQKQKKSPKQPQKQKPLHSPDLIQPPLPKQPQKSPPNSSLLTQHKQPQNNSNRLTIPNLMEGEYISLLCQIKLELLEKKYSPNMSLIFQQTCQFEEEE